jgi:hypothetical protein
MEQQAGQDAAAPSNTVVSDVPGKNSQLGDL